MAWNKSMNRKKVIGMFFLGLLLMLALELSLVWLLRQVIGLPAFEWGWLNPILGLLAVAVGAWLVIWSVRIQYTEGLGTPYPKVATQKLIVSGPYACTRNPMTLGAALFYLGISIWAGSAAVTGLVLIIFTGLLTYIYTHETRELSERFGAEYLDYKQKTSFLIPWRRYR